MWHSVYRVFFSSFAVGSIIHIPCVPIIYNPRNCVPLCQLQKASSHREIQQRASSETVKIILFKFHIVAIQRRNCRKAWWNLLSFATELYELLGDSKFQTIL